MTLLAILASAGLLAAVQIPPYATPAQETTLAGTIAGFDGKYHLRLHDDRGYFDDVTLHRGTVITPTGQRLTSGMRVTIRGAADGKTFDADEIDVAPEDATAAPQENSPGPYTPLIGSPGIPCNTWDCAPYGYYGPGYYPGYYSAPYYVGPPVIIIPAQPPVQPTPMPFRRRRPLDVPQQHLALPPLQQLPPQYTAVPPPRAVMPAPVYRAPALPPEPHQRAVLTHAGPMHH